MKKQVHICLIGPCVKDEQGLYNLLHLDHVEELRYELIIDNIHPEFIIVTELFYRDLKCRKKFAELYNDEVVTIFMTGECVAPDLNLFDYAVCFDSYDKSDRVICYPYRDHFREYLGESLNSYTGKIDFAQDELSRKTGFCNFIYSNPNGHKSREDIFHIINSYKKVDALGAFLNNTGFHDENGCSFEEKVRNSVYLKSKYKFTIAFENEISQGYTTEKVFMALEAHSIPIYWGNPEIGKIVNEKSIINCHQFENFHQVLERVKQIDQDDALWCQMVSEPWMTDEQEELERTRERGYYNFLERIFLEKHAAPAERGSGTFADYYKDFIFGNADEYEKSLAKFHLCMNWIRIHHQGKGINNLFQDSVYKTVAVYGMGDIGMIAYEEIRKCGSIETVYGIDQGTPLVPKDMKCFRLHEVEKGMKPDAVIITVLAGEEKIEEDLQKHFSCDIYRIADILKGMEQI